MDFNDQIKEQLRGERVQMSRLVEFRFRSGVQRYWPGQYEFVDTDGTRWYPTRGVGAVTGLAQSSNGSAPELKFELSGVTPEFNRKVLDPELGVPEYYGRLVRVFWQFWTQAWVPIMAPRAITWGLMRSIVSVREQTDEGTLSKLILTAETPFEGRVRSRNGYLTDTDQKARHRGDRILEQVAGNDAREIKFPIY